MFNYSMVSVQSITGCGLNCDQLMGAELQGGLRAKFQRGGLRAKLLHGGAGCGPGCAKISGAGRLRTMLLRGGLRAMRHNMRGGLQAEL